MELYDLCTTSVCHMPIVLRSIGWQGNANQTEVIGFQFVRHKSV